MINDLRYAVSFPTNGVSLSGSLSFQPGSTAITGDNGAGKSFVAEMIRYGLFGKKALRGPASDYKTLDMELGFQVASEKYRIVRTSRKEFLYDAEDEQLAVGADAINKKIVDILGFDLEVFDVVCAANQKESERLTRLTPARRKELIDDVVGLTRQEAVEKACKEEAKTARTEAEALTRALVLPTEPVKPEGYHLSSKLKAEYDDTVGTLANRIKLQRIIDAAGDEPERPDDAEVDVEELEAHEKERVRNDAHRAALERQIASISDPTHTRAQVNAGKAWLEYADEKVRRGPQSEYRTDQLDQYEAIETAQKKAGQTIECPKCLHEFHAGLTPEEERLLAGYSPLSLKEIAVERRKLDNWSTPLPCPAGDPMTREDIQRAELALLRADEKQMAIEELDRLPVLVDLSVELKAAREIAQRWAIYERDFRAFQMRESAARDAQTELAKLSVPKRTPEDIHADYTAAIVYERDLARYEADKQRFDALSAEIAEKQERADAFAAGAKGLVEARRTLKAFLAPSLSRVSSKIITQMTENSLRPLETIVVDEDMNITADGQDVSTFNGAHATMINLALRLALGQVLVARVFPLFIGDEIDSDATPTNAQAIADGLMACKEQLKQIVLISHKRLEGVDHEVML